MINLHLGSLSFFPFIDATKKKEKKSFEKGGNITRTLEKVFIEIETQTYPIPRSILTFVSSQPPEEARKKEKKI